MSVNPIDENSTPKNTGSLEELFRHHLGEEATVPPRPMLWDQIDNSLLIRQNEIYRKRLVATRWVAAASLLLATLAGTGWWAGRDGHLLSSPEMTAVSQPASKRNDRATVAHPATAVGTGRSIAQHPGVVPSGTSAEADAANALASNSADVAIAPRRYGAASARLQATYAAGGPTIAAERHTRSSKGAGTGQHFGSSAAAGQALQSIDGKATPSAVAGNFETTAAYSAATSVARNATPAAAQVAEAGTLTGSDVHNKTGLALTDNAVIGTDEAILPVTGSATASVDRAQTGLLSTRLASLNTLATAALPNDLATLPLPAEMPVLDAHCWRYSANYTAGIFNPNINFSRSGIEQEYDYNPALGPDSPKLTEAAATQYREHLRPGLSQRIALLASRHLGGHWSLSTGAEFTQATARSASSSTFVGEQLIDLGQSANGPLRTTDFRYRMASVPVELRYTNPVKRGWSLYGRLGGVVTALLGVRSDVEGSPEATRTYSIASAGTPYRRVLGSLRGAAGTQFRTPTGKWAFSVGPVAEIGLTAMNAHPVQSYFAQSHPYSFGMEAGVEFGR